MRSGRCPSSSVAFAVASATQTGSVHPMAGTTQWRTKRMIFSRSCVSNIVFVGYKEIYERGGESLPQYLVIYLRFLLLPKALFLSSAIGRVDGLFNRLNPFLLLCRELALGTVAESFFPLDGKPSRKLGERQSRSAGLFPPQIDRGSEDWKAFCVHRANGSYSLERCNCRPYVGPPPQRCISGWSSDQSPVDGLNNLDLGKVSPLQFSG